MVFQNPGLAALHHYITGEESVLVPTSQEEQNLTETKEEKAVVEEIAKDIQDDARLERSKWKGGFGQ